MQQWLCSSLYRAGAKSPSGHNLPWRYFPSLKNHERSACIQLLTLEHGLRAEAYRALHQCNRALADYTIARKSDPDNPTYVKGEAAANLCSHHFGAAVADYWKFAILSTTPSRFYRQAAWIKGKKTSLHERVKGTGG